MKHPLVVRLKEIIRQLRLAGARDRKMARGFKRGTELRTFYGGLADMSKQTARLIEEALKEFPLSTDRSRAGAAPVRSLRKGGCA